MNVNPTQETIELVSQAQKTPLPDDVTRAITQPATATSGLIAYDLEAPAKKLYPILTPLRNRIARRADGYGIQSNWRAVTGINTGLLQIGVPEGQRGGVMAQSTADYYAKFVGCGLENYVTFEADMASKNFEDVKALAVTQLLQSVMIQEEFLDLGGNGTAGLNGGNATPTPSCSDVTTGGSLAANTPYYVGCVALTLAGYQQVAAVNNGMVGQSIAFAAKANSLTPAYSITGADGQGITFGGGVGKPSAIGTVTTANDSNATHKVAATVTPVAGAVAYAWFFGAANAAASLYLTAVTTVNCAIFSAAADNTAQPFSEITNSDNGANAYVYDGLLTQITKTNSGAYVANLATPTAGGSWAGTKLTSNGYGGITEIDTAFQSFWNNYRLSPDEIFVNAQQLIDMNALIIANGGAPLIRYNLDANNPGGQIEAGVVVGSILNVITNKYVKVTVHPNLPPGTIMFWSNSIPYPLNDVGSIVLKHLRRDYYQVEWPLRTRKYEYGVYFDGVLKNYFPPAYGLIKNIGAGH